MLLNRETHTFTLTQIAAAALVGGLLLSGCAAATSDTETTGPPDATASQGENSPDPTQEPAAEEVASEDADTQGSEDENTEPAQAAATVTLEGETFTFSPSTCMITEEDVLVEAGGTNDQTGDPAFLSIDLTLGTETTGEVRIELGTDNPFESTDDFYTLFFGDGDAATLDAQFPHATFGGTFYVSAGTVLGEGTGEVICC